MPISWDDAQTFLAIAESGSFSAAALELGVGQPTVSRRIGLFEDELGYPLFHRGRRGTELTREGEKLLPAAQQMARWAVEMEAMVAGTEERAEGRVAVAAPPGLAWENLVPFARRFRDRFPAIRFELLAAVEYVDLTRGEADLAIRMRPSDDPALETVGAFEMTAGPYATRDYAATLPDDPTPADVDWIAWSRRYRHVSPNPELEALIDGFEPAFAADRYLLQLRACASGLGAMFLPDGSVAQRPDESLVPLDLGLAPHTSSLYLVCARSMRWVPRVRAVLDALMSEFERELVRREVK